jgi:hypothetical protein
MEGEEVTHVVASGGHERVQEFVLAVSSVQVGMLGRAGPLGQAQVKRETTLEQPAVRSNRDETRQQAIEGHPLAIPRQVRSHPDGSLPEPPLKGLAEGRDIPVRHVVVSVRIRSTNRRARSGRPAAAARRRRGVVSPRSRAWRMASLQVHPTGVNEQGL